MRTLILSAALAVATTTTLVSASENDKEPVVSLALKPLSGGLSDLQSKLSDQFGDNRLLGKWFWGMLLQAAPESSYLRESLVAVRFVMSETKDLSSLQALEQSLSNRLAQYGLKADFVANQKDWFNRLYDAQKAEHSSVLWALPFVVEQVNALSQQPGLPTEVKAVMTQTLQTLQVAVPAAEAMAQAGGALLDLVQKTGCCGLLGK